MDTNLFDRNHANFFLVAGPCVIENEHLPMEIALRLQDMCTKLDIPLVFKASYRKANRSRLDSFTGIGDERGLELLQEIRETLHIPVLTDIHSVEDARKASSYVDVLQIPAFLCRQTDLLLAAGESGRWVNVKKGQFVSPESMAFAVEKIKSTGNDHILLTERGTTFGYQDLVVDFRGIPTMQSFDVPVVMDVTHSLQQPNQSQGVSGGLPHRIETIAKAAIAVGVDGIFIETHPQPSMALSDGANMLPLDQMERLLSRLICIRNSIQNF